MKRQERRTGPATERRDRRQERTGEPLANPQRRGSDQQTGFLSTPALVPDASPVPSLHFIAGPDEGQAAAFSELAKILKNSGFVLIKSTDDGNLWEGKGLRFFQNKKNRVELRFGQGESK